MPPDYTDLNKVCPKDAYPLPCIDRLVDDASWHSIFSFLDAYCGYNQVKMHPADEEKTAFITENANFCYKVMPFGLKNAKATYQRLMDKVFQGQIGRNIEIYVDDMVVKSNSVADHLADLAEIFGELRNHNMRLNPEKCTFRVKGGKFLEFILSARGIEANRDKCQAVLDMRMLEEHQSSPSDFHHSAFSWNEPCEEAFASLKMTLATSPILTRPKPSSPLQLYLAVSDEAISSVLVQEKEGSQVPVYFVSRLLQDPETRQGGPASPTRFTLAGWPGPAHFWRDGPKRGGLARFAIPTDCPISKVLGKPELAGRMMAWSVELSQFNITFKLRGPIKAQCLADFVNELDPHGHFEEHWWILHVDGSSNGQGSGAGVILEGPKGITLEQSLRFRFKASNNQAEYEALLAGLRLAEDMGASSIKCLTDSKVVAEQVDVHEGIYGMHSGARMTVSKFLRAGYYWPTMNTDCTTFVKKFQPCQKHGHAEQLHCIPPAWPFATRRADILGPFPVAKGQCKFLIVTVNLFTKWIEAEPLASISAHQVQRFLWKNIIT
uniref:Transposon Ty3-I Gag-Pol polyprotein n=1 Tax=Cajanus cajan TaxID=3821 RepID=A0A151RP38_CAJCA|nr:Transposon Ty3-I Gag-Pol polyprotein [Cajanus cajan]